MKFAAGCGVAVARNMQCAEVSPLLAAYQPEVTEIALVQVS